MGSWQLACANVMWFDLEVAGRGEDLARLLFPPVRGNRPHQEIRRHLHPDAIGRRRHKYARHIGVGRGYLAHSICAMFIATISDNEVSLENVQYADRHADLFSMNLSSSRV